MEFFIAMNPPTVTAQMKQVRVVNNKPVFFDPPKVKEARQALSGYLAQHKPEKPMEGAVSLKVIWLFPKGKSHKNGEFRKTKPDTDNLQKLLKDCMTQTGFWKDDALVVQEYVEKRWSSEPCGIYIEVGEIKDGHV
ncbi:MAG: RusA family crossover junction endodeoxyribonuclease [Lachnospiraceae bacterium]|nr:RusA family crossover junction endodeoxyribonuclease [Lachnospiraceae bacterium]